MIKIWRNKGENDIRGERKIAERKEKKKILVLRKMPGQKCNFVRK